MTTERTTTPIESRKRKLLDKQKKGKKKMREHASVNIPHDVYVTVTGTDLIRQPDGQFAVLEDNLRVPSGASYMLANRQVMKNIFPRLFSDYGVRPLDSYGQTLLNTLRSLSPGHRPDLGFLDDREDRREE